MKFLMHVDEENAEVQVDGRSFSIPPNELFEVPEIRGTDCNNNGQHQYISPPEHVAKVILNAAWYHGMIEVPVTRKGFQMEVDIPAARAEADARLREAEHKMLERYVMDQRERALANAPPLPPSGRLVTIIKRRGIDLKRDFNIDPPGWAMTGIFDRDQRMAELEAQNQKLMEMMAQMAARLDATADKSADKPKRKETTPEI